METIVNSVKSIFVYVVSLVSIFAVEWLQIFNAISPVLTFFVQLIIGIFTIIYLYKQIKHFKK